MQELTTKIWLRLHLAQILEPKLLVHEILKFDRRLLKYLAELEIFIILYIKLYVFLYIKFYKISSLALMSATPFEYIAEVTIASAFA